MQASAHCSAATTIRHAQLLQGVAVLGKRRGIDLDADLVDRGLRLVVDLVALLGDDRDRADLIEERRREVVDLRRRRLSSREHAEVDPNLERGRLVLVHGERQGGIGGHQPVTTRKS